MINNKDEQNIIKQLSKKIYFLKEEYQKLDCFLPLLQKKNLTIDEIISLLNHNEEYNNTHIDLLVNILYEKFVDESFFYLPEIITLLTFPKYQKSSLVRFILDQSKNNIKYSLILNWFFGSLNYYYITNLIEESLVNRKLNIRNKNEILDEKKIFEDTLIKQLRVDYYYSNNKFYQELTNICMELKNIKEIERNDYLDMKINQLNDIIEKNNNNISNIFKGIILPLNNIENNNDENNFIIVNILNEYSTCLSTKARVPIKITFECIKAFECNDWKNLYDKKYKKKMTKNKKKLIETEKKTSDKNKVMEYNSLKSFYEEMEKNKIKTQIDKILEEVKYENLHPEIMKNKHNNIKNNKNNNLKETFLCDITEPIPLNENPFGEKFHLIIEKKIKPKSPFQKFNTYTIKQFIYKSNDDLRQELLIMQLIKKFDVIFKKLKLPLKLRPYEIIVTSNNSGLIEFIPNSISIDSLLKFIKSKNYTLSSFFKKFFEENFLEAQKNFIESLAGYSLICYLLSIKDRNNRNILLDLNGNIIHIDYGFVLGISPGNNFNFENAPFKLNDDYLSIMNDEMFDYFRSIFTRGLMELKKFYKEFEVIIELMYKGNNNILPCFIGRDYDEIISSFKKKFLLQVGDNDFINAVDEIINEARDSYRTTQYDIYQKLTTGINY